MMRPICSARGERQSPVGSLILRRYVCIMFRHRSFQDLQVALFFFFLSFWSTDCNPSIPSWVIFQVNDRDLQRHGQFSRCIYFGQGLIYTPGPFSLQWSRLLRGVSIYCASRSQSFLGFHIYCIYFPIVNNVSKRQRETPGNLMAWIQWWTASHGCASSGTCWVGGTESLQKTRWCGNK